MADDTRLVFFKLMGEDKYVLAEYVLESDDSVVVKYPVVFSSIVTESDGFVMDAYKLFPFSADDKVVVEKRTIAAYTKPKKVIVDRYVSILKKQFGSEPVVPVPSTAGTNTLH